MAVRKEIRDLLERIDRSIERWRERLDRIEDRAERELVQIFAAAEGSVLERIPRLLRERKINIDQATAWVTDIERILDRVLVVGGRQWVDTQFSLAYEWALDRVQDAYLAGLGIDNIRLIDDDAIRAALLDFTEADDVVFRSGLRRGYDLIRGINRELMEHLRDTLVQGVALGEETNIIADQLTEGGRLRPIGRFTLEQRAQMIARTELARIGEEASAVKSASVGIRHFRWSALVGDPRTAKDSLLRHGRVKTMDQWRRYSPDRFSGPPPIRPNDRCKLVPIKREWIREEKARQDFDRALKDDKRLIWNDVDRKIISAIDDVPDDFL